MDSHSLKGAFRRGQGYAGAGLWDKAVTDLQLALKMQPTNKEIQQELAHAKEQLHKQQHYSSLHQKVTDNVTRHLQQ
jgi:uncharacterized protein HemY